MNHGGIQGNCVSQVGRISDHLDEKCLPRRHIEGVDQSLKQAQCDDLHDVNPVWQRQRRQGKRLDHRQDLGNDDHPASIDPVHQDTGKRRDAKHRDLPDETGNAEHPGFVGEGIDEPDGRDLSKECANQRYKLAGEEEAIVAVAQRPQKQLNSRRFGRSFIRHDRTVWVRCVLHK